MAETPKLDTTSDDDKLANLSQDTPTDLDLNTDEKAHRGAAASTGLNVKSDASKMKEAARDSGG
jgi:hypothetical protein